MIVIINYRFLAIRFNRTMDINLRDMAGGMKAGLALVITFLLTLLTVLVYKIVGFFISGALGQAATASNFDNDTIANITAARTTFATQVGLTDNTITVLATLIIVVAIIGVFIWIFKQKGSGSGDMPY
jgi:hypothetical protein